MDGRTEGENGNSAVFFLTRTILGFPLGIPFEVALIVITLFFANFY